jgi:hypothetical protein
MRTFGKQQLKAAKEMLDKHFGGSNPRVNPLLELISMVLGECGEDCKELTPAEYDAWMQVSGDLREETILKELLQPMKQEEMPVPQDPSLLLNWAEFLVLMALENMSIYVPN